MQENKLFEAYCAIDAQIKELNEKKDLLREKIMDIDFEEADAGVWKLQKQRRLSFKLKEGLDVDIVGTMFPDAIVTKQTIDVNYLKNNAEAHSLLEQVETYALAPKLKV